MSKNGASTEKWCRYQFVWEGWIQSSLYRLSTNVVDINICTTDGISPITTAIFNEFTNIVQLLTKFGTEFNLP